MKLERARVPRPTLFTDVAVVSEAGVITAYTRVVKQASQLYSYMYLSIKEESNSACWSASQISADQRRSMAMTA